MALTSVAYLVNGSATVISGMTTVYSSASYNTVAGWNTFHFQRRLHGMA